MTILERSSDATREGQAAGIGLTEHSQKFVDTYDRLKDKISIGITAADGQLIDRELEVIRNIPLNYKMTTWDVLYYRLRANFDGMKSTYCPSPPGKQSGEGVVRYEQGQTVQSIRDLGREVLVEVSAQDSQPTMLKADLVIAADGGSSLLRQHLLPRTYREYPGYVIWRGTVPATSVDPAFVALLSNHPTFHTMKYNYMIFYIIPGPNGGIAKEDLLINFAWYYHVSSAVLEEILTDVDGHKHRITVPKGKLSPTVWTRQVARAHADAPEAIAKVMEAMPEPFVSKVTSLCSSRATHLGGKVLLVGDALAQFRPHIGSGADNATLAAMHLDAYLRGDMTLREWEENVMTFATVNRARSQLFGSFYMNGKAWQIWYLTRFRMLLWWQGVWKRLFGSSYGTWVQGNRLVNLDMGKKNA